MGVVFYADVCLESYKKYFSKQCKVGNISKVGQDEETLCAFA